MVVGDDGARKSNRWISVDNISLRLAKDSRYLPAEEEPGEDLEDDTSEDDEAEKSYT